MSLDFKILFIVVALIEIIQTEKVYETKTISLDEQNIVKRFKWVSPTQCILRCQTNNHQAVNYKKKCLCVENNSESDSLPPLAVEPSNSATGIPFRYVEILRPCEEKVSTTNHEISTPISSLINEEITPATFQITPTNAVLNYPSTTPKNSAVSNQIAPQTTLEVSPTPSLTTALQTSVTTTPPATTTTSSSPQPTTTAWNFNHGNCIISYFVVT